MTIGIVVVAAGSGSRFGALKQFELLAGIPLVEHALRAFDTFPGEAKRVVVFPREGGWQEQWTKISAGLTSKWLAVPGGATRADSVHAGLMEAGEECSIVAVHDGARPFPPMEALKECLEILASEPSLAAVIVSRRATDTLREFDEKTLETGPMLDRSRIAMAETPQVCRRALLLGALAASASLAVTDEGQALQCAGHHVRIALHDGWNPKVTTPHDLMLAEAFLKAGSK